MELDDLKERWRTTNAQQSDVDIREVLKKKIVGVKASGRGIRMIFIVEVIVLIAVYVGILLLVLLVRERLMTYMYKIIFVTTISSIPVIWRMYKSQRWITTMDYANDIRSNILAFLDYYKATLRLYKWTSYVVIVILMILLLTDSDFSSLSMNLKIAIITYMAVAMILTAPYIRLTYGRKTQRLEEFLHE